MFPITVVKKLSQTCWLKQHKCDFLHFWSPEVLKQSLWANGKALPRESSEGRASCLFWLRALHRLCSLACPVLRLQSQWCYSFKSLPESVFPSTRLSNQLPPSDEHPCDYISTTI